MKAKLEHVETCWRSSMPNSHCEKWCEMSSRLPSGNLPCFCWEPWRIPRWPMLWVPGICNQRQLPRELNWCHDQGYGECIDACAKAERHRTAPHGGASSVKCLGQSPVFSLVIWQTDTKRMWFSDRCRLSIYVDLHVLWSFDFDAICLLYHIYLYATVCLETRYICPDFGFKDGQSMPKPPVRSYCGQLQELQDNCKEASS